MHAVIWAFEICFFSIMACVRNFKQIPPPQKKIFRDERDFVWFCDANKSLSVSKLLLYLFIVFYYQLFQKVESHLIMVMVVQSHYILMFLSSFTAFCCVVNVKEWICGPRKGSATKTLSRLILWIRTTEKLLDSFCCSLYVVSIFIWLNFCIQIKGKSITEVIFYLCCYFTAQRNVYHSQQFMLDRGTLIKGSWFIHWLCCQWTNLFNIITEHVRRLIVLVNLLLWHLVLVYYILLEHLNFLMCALQCFICWLKK